MIEKDKPIIVELDGGATLWSDGSDLVASLQHTPRRIPSYYGYDKLGSELFDAITRLPAYYLTATEYTLFESYARAIADSAGCDWFIELGSGSARKTRLLLAAAAARRPTTFLPVDVSREMLEASLYDVRAAVPGLAVIGLVGKWESGLEWLSVNRDGVCLVAFLGSGLGNMLRHERHDLLARISAFCAPGDLFLTTADLDKPTPELERAYNDSPGCDLWGQFRLNRLTRLNALFDGNFKLARYYERCHYDERTSTIEARVYASEPQKVHLAALGLELGLARGESIVVDYSVKFWRPALLEELNGYGFEPIGEWINGLRQYGVFLMSKR